MPPWTSVSQSCPSPSSNTETSLFLLTCQLGRGWTAKLFSAEEGRPVRAVRACKHTRVSAERHGKRGSRARGRGQWLRGVPETTPSPRLCLCAALRARKRVH